VKIVDGESFPYRCPDTRSACLDALQQNMKLLIPVQRPPPRNLFLTWFRISKAYLKGLLGSVSLRIPVENSSVLREDYLGINCYMFLLAFLCCNRSTVEV
jgi:hypothetical protein